jgi:Zn-finger nucleic acid-binding protein
MDCPRCAVELSPITHHESTVHRCADCGGLWTDVAELNRVLLHGNLPALSATGGFVNPEEMTGLCPACSVDLVVVQGGEKKNVAYDTCESCGGVWVEGEEDEPAPELGWRDAEKQIIGFFKRFAKKKSPLAR